MSVTHWPDHGDHPPGVIALPCSDLARYSANTLALAALTKPPGSILHMVQSISIAANLNTALRTLWEDEILRWLHVQGDDHAYNPDTLIRLLDREVDVVVPLVTRRQPPFAPVIFKGRGKNGYQPFAWDELPPEGLVECYAAGSAGLTVRREVLERIVEEQGHDRVFEFTGGVIVNEDMEFCRKLRELDPPVKIWCDVEVVLGHASVYIVVPTLTEREDGERRWGLQFQMGEGPDGLVRGVYVNINDPTEEELEEAVTAGIFEGHHA